MKVRAENGTLLGYAVIATEDAGLVYNARNGKRFYIAYWRKIIDSVEENEVCIKLRPGQDPNDLPHFTPVEHAEC